MLLTILVIAGVFLDDQAGPPADSRARQIQIAQFWMTMICYSLGAWFARISLMLSTVRLIPTSFVLRRISESAFISLLLLCIGILTAKLSFCASDLSWYRKPNPFCPILGNAKLGVAELTTALVADVIIVAIPLRLLYRISLQREKRRMLLLMFSANIITGIVSVLRVVFLIGSSPGLLTIAVKAEIGTALMVADMAIITPYIYRLVKPEGDFDSKPDTYYRSVQPDGGIIMRRVADLVPDTHLDNTTQDSTAAISCASLPDPETAANISSMATESTGSEELGVRHQKPFTSSLSDITYAKSM
ncbi:hypothetical protein GYMLUDRAFT_42886 [Collybiopsis luxurians FD-317 M1]|uniref:Rhodopsin domain-containing protein n=1 Tax=Collybiopsis luxurians FD-317 M1 TaxID=944289 RepID=A0A0D0BC51_9AGAR|nr:hypothetical protein GYMLUDRAFT_42886 [Collybiopsis luxurians FD-317 M1]